METFLPDTQQQILRQKGIIFENEIAKNAGDLFFAENILTGARRILDKSVTASLTENKRTLLRD